MASLRVAYTVIAMVPFVCANGHYETVTREDPHPPAPLPHSGCYDTDTLVHGQGAMPPR